MTSKDYLSQEEIDALLNQSSASYTDEGSKSEISINDYLTALEQDALGEIGNITFGSAATALSTLLGKKVDITTPQVSIISRENFSSEFPKPHVAVHVTYVDGFEGINSLVIHTRDAQVIANLMLGGDGQITEDEELNDIHISAVQEAMNQMMGSSATSMSTIFNRFVNISPPGIDILNIESGRGVQKLPTEDYLVKVSFRLIIGDLIDSTIMQLLSISFAKELVASLLGEAAAEPEAPAPTPVANESVAANEQAAAAMHMNPNAGFSAVDPTIGYEPTNAPSMPYAEQQAQQPMMHQQPMYGQPMYAQPQAYQQHGYGAPMGQPSMLGNGANRNVQQVQFASFQNTPYLQTEETNLNLLLDIPLKVTVELGRTQKQIKEILELSQGSIIELDKLAGEPVDILVNNKLIAKGEVVVIDENFGVRVTDIVSQWDRIQKLQ
ncbi:flagellar motor switch phosphatase FliY [Paenibacillus guangzhouensis]|uniref:flagellar motor switch phosphatase FliY n=1 Tax=Paenibacillus guangzhouensis TaxID=1473112 RepID=UPI001266C1DD|nr:flagellar motor switch phosphatase FliY [Paenibacillus guangzhouensis]